MIRGEEHFLGRLPGSVLAHCKGDRLKRFREAVTDAVAVGESRHVTHDGPGVYLEAPRASHAALGLPQGFG